MKIQRNGLTDLLCVLLVVMIVATSVFAFNPMSVTVPSDWGQIKGLNINSYDFGWEAVTVDDYQRIKSWGMTMVQFCLLWHQIEPSPGEYDENFLVKIDGQMDLAGESGLKVVLRVGVSGTYGIFGSYTEADLWINSMLQTRLVELWEMLVTRYKDESHIIAWNILNEPHDTANVWNGDGILSNSIITAIRNIDPERTIVVMPSPGSARGLSLAEPVPFENIVYGVSFYEPYAVTSTGEEYDAFRKQGFEEAKNYLIISMNQGKKAWVQEFGINLQNAGGDPPTNNGLQWIIDVCEMAETENIGWCYWVYSINDWQYQVLNSDGTERSMVEILKDYAPTEEPETEPPPESPPENDTESTSDGTGGGYISPETEPPVIWPEFPEGPAIENVNFLILGVASFIVVSILLREKET